MHTAVLISEPCYFPPLMTYLLLLLLKPEFFFQNLRITRDFIFYGYVCKKIDFFYNSTAANHRQRAGIIRS